MPHRPTAEDKKFQTQDDVRILKQAEEIKLDKPRMQRAAVQAKTEVKALQKVARKR